MIYRQCDLRLITGNNDLIIKFRLLFTIRVNSHNLNPDLTILRTVTNLYCYDRYHFPAPIYQEVQI